MNKTNFIIFISMILSVVSLSDCSGSKDQYTNSFDFDTLNMSHSMKGWELYSEPSGGDWTYYILQGTNRLKTYEEVVTNVISVTGTDSLKLLLDKFPSGEELFWFGEIWLERTWGSHHGNLCLPDSEVISEMQDYCLLKGLLLNICNQ
jgi:hypothetical protein